MTTISGTIYDVNGDLAVGRVVRAYRRDTGALLGEEITSDGAPIPVDPDYSSASLILSFEGSDGATSTTDESASPKTITFNGAAAISTDHSVFGGSSLETFQGSSAGHLSISSSADFNVGTGDFYIGCRIRLKATGVDVPIFHTSGGWNNSDGMFFGYWSSAGGFIASCAGAFTASASLSISAGVWYWVELVRDSGTCRLYVDGVQRLTFSSSGNASSTSAFIAKGGAAPFGQDGGAYIDDFVFLKGTSRGRDGTSFDVPDAPFELGGDSLPEGEYLIDCGGYTGEVQRIVLDDAAGTLYNDIIDRVFPG